MLSVEYLAGLFDGEGYIIVDHRRLSTHRVERCQIKVGISLVYKPVIQKLADQFHGVLNVNDSAHRKSPRNRIVYAWVASSKPAVSFLRLVTPHLIIKREQAELALLLQENIDEHYGFMRNRWLDRNDPKRLAILDYRTELALKIKELKKETFELPVNGGAHSSV